MTQTDYARHRGVSKGQVSNWKKRGLLIIGEDDAGHARVNVERSDARINSRVDQARGRPSTGAMAKEDSPPSLLADTPPPPSSPDNALADERTQLLREQRTGAALKNAREAGQLVALLEAERRVSEAGRVARERMQAWLRGIAERFAACTDVRMIMTLGEEGIDAVFAELSAAAARGDIAGEDDDPQLSPEETAELEAAAA